MKKTYNYLKPMGHSKSSYNRDVNSDTVLPQEIRKTLNTLNLHLKPTREKNNKTLNLEEIIFLRGKKSWKSRQNKWNRDEEHNRKDQWN